MHNTEALNLDKFFESRNVEWISLSEAVTFQRGKRIKKTELTEDGQYPVINGGKTIMGYTDKFNKEANSVVIVREGSCGFSYFVTEKFWLGDSCYDVNPVEGFLEKHGYDETYFKKFIYYVFQMQQINLQNKIQGSVFAKLPANIIGKIQIPLLNFSDLKKTVESLDQFIVLQENIKQELELSKLRYKYCRSKILNDDFIKHINQQLNGSNATLETFTIKDLAKIYTGKPIFNTETDYSYPYECYGSSGLLKEKAKDFIFDQPTVVMGRTGSLDNIIYVDKPFWAIDSVYYFEKLSDKLDFKFLYHFLKNFNLEKLSFYTTRPTLNHGLIYSIEINLPSVNTQQRIAELLDQFEELEQNLNQELKARVKQYEYYRSALFEYFIQ